MTSKRWKVMKALALVLAFAVSQVCVQASLSGRPKASTQQTDAPQLVRGRIVTSQNKPVMVNGNSVPSGTTIFSGAKVVTSAGKGATIDLGSLGRVDVGPNTHLSLTFSEGTVTVNLQSGYVVLTTNQDVKGSVIVPQGAVTSTDPTKVSSVVVTVGEQGPRTAAAAATGADNAATMTAAAASAFVTGALVNETRRGRGRGRNLSPGTPRGPR